MHGQIVQPPSASTDGQSPSAGEVLEDPLELQKKVMQQSRELARKRRQEEEAREEAAKRERIAAKLAALPPMPEKKKDTPKDEKSVPTQIQTREGAIPKPEGTEASVESKVNSSEPIDEISGAMSSLEIKSPDKQTSNQEQHRTNGLHSGQGPSISRDQQSSQDNRQSWQSNSASASGFKPWAPAPSQQSSRNVWGPPTNDRTLGNGTFNPELSRIPDMSSNPGPIGPPNGNRGNGQFQQGRGREPYGSRPAPIGPPNRQQQQPLSRQQQEQRDKVASSGWGSLPDRLAQEDVLLSQQHDLEIARRRELQEQGLAPEITQPVIKDTWRQVSINEDGTRSKVQASITTVHGEPSQPGPSTWKDQEEATTRGIFEEQENARRRQFDAVGSVPAPQFNETWRAPSNMTASPPVRGSRFFPSNNRDVRLDVRLDEQLNFDRSGSPSPPPPTMAGHPAYDGDSANPHVHLPRGPIVVKLPPATVLAPIGPPKPASFAAAVQAPSVPQVNYNTSYGRHEHPSRATHSFQDVRRQEPGNASNWQDRINSLIGRKNSPPKSHALAVDSSSKHALELPDPVLSATVSFPSLGLGDPATDDGTVESKPAAEECFEEQEMGSLPVIKVPNLAPPNAWTLAPPQPKSIPKKFVIQHVTSVEPLPFAQQISNNSTTITIKVPGQDEPKSVSIAVAARQHSNPRRGSSRGTPRNGSSSHPRGGRGRDSSNGFPSPSLDDASSSSSPSGRGGRGGRGGYGSNWNRHVSTPVHT
jgi:hypothetical protein